MRHRLNVQLIKRTKTRLADELCVSPSRVGQATDPREAIATAIHGAVQASSALGTLENLLKQKPLPNAAVATPAARWDAYYLRLEPLAAPIMKARLEAGAELAAELILAAWVEAGKPDPARWTAAAASADPRSPADPPAGGYVGSRNSETYHRVDCSHVERIKPENRVRYPTEDEAAKAGRKPCRACMKSAVRPDPP
jgi:hypothetical protein